MSEKGTKEKSIYGHRGPASLIAVSGLQDNLASIRSLVCRRPGRALQVLSLKVCVLAAFDES